VARSTSNTRTDEQELAALGYKQELRRSWSGFSNFAISFSIICILSGGLTSFGQAWNNGGPAVVAIGWPVVCALILVIGLCMAELVSAYPTSGGLYWWASHLGSPRAGFFTGWLNMIGLMAAVSAVGYGTATFFDATVSAYSKSWTNSYSLHRIFIEFVVLLIIAALLNIYGSQVLAAINQFSVWWLLGGVVAVIAILFAVPNHHESIGWVFSHRINNSGFASSHLHGFMFWLYVFPLGFLLTQYTIAGFDSSAHMSEETEGANRAAASGLWKAILYSSVVGWVMELAFLFAVPPGTVGTSASGAPLNGADAVSAGGGSVTAIFSYALTSDWAGFVLLLSTVAQVFCTIAILTSASRMTYAFSRDGAVPFSRKWSQIDDRQIPKNAILLVSGVALLLTVPALFSVRVGGGTVPLAFYAVVSVTVIALYVAYAIPIWLRWRARDRFTPGPWNLGKHFRWLNLVATLEIAVVSVYFILPTTPAAVPFRSGFTWKAFNFAPVLTIGSLIILWVAWQVSVKKWFKGPIRYTTVEAVAGDVSEAPRDLIELERALQATGETATPEEPVVG
jgi:amino acid transporter